MSEQQELKIDKERYSNLLGMMNSSDTENSVIALQCIENMPYDENRMPILLLKKQAKISADLWKEHAPKLYEYLQGLGVDPSKVITYKGVLEVIKANHKDEEVTFYTKTLEEYLLSEMHALGYTFLEKLEINVKFKDDKTGTTRKNK